MADVLDMLESRLHQFTARGLTDAVSAGIRDGVLPSGTKLPPIRVVATRLGLSPTTVSASWALLARSGAIRTDGRRGTTIADTSVGGPARYRQALERQVTFELDLSTGVPDPALLPNLGSALKRLKTAGTPSSYLDDPVLPDLIDVLRGDWPYDAEAYTVVDGAMDALELATRSLIRFGHRVIVEHPTFPPLLDLLEEVGANVVGVDVDDQGMRSEPLAAALSSPAAAVFLQPRAHNPTGASLTTPRAEQLVSVLRAAGTTVIEDDSAGSVATAAPISLGQWLPEQTLHIRSFSKSHGPDLRLAAISGRSDVIGAIVRRRQLGQGWSSRLLQRILLNLLTDRIAIEQVAHARTEYRLRREAVVDGLEEHGVRISRGDGINIWIPVADESAAIVRLASQGIGVTPGAPFAVLPGQAPHIRVTTGLIAVSHARVAAQLAAASRTGSWTGGR